MHANRMPSAWQLPATHEILAMTFSDMVNIRQLLMAKGSCSRTLSFVPCHPCYQPSSLIVSSSAGFIMILTFKLVTGILCFIAFALLCITDVFFYKLKAKLSTSKKIMLCFVVVLGSRTSNSFEVCL